MDQESTHGQMAVITMVNGSIITWMASAFTLGKMADNIVASTKMTRNMLQNFD